MSIEDDDRESFWDYISSPVTDVGDVLYHRTDHPTAVETGLDPQMHEFDPDFPDAVFLTPDPNIPRGRYTYAIDVSGLTLYADPYFFEPAYFVTERIAPERITLHSAS